MPKSVHYTLSCSNAQENFILVQVIFPVDESNLRVFIPAWRPGRYELGNFSKNIRNFRAFSNNVEATVVKKDRNSWEISDIQGKKLTVEYEYYSNEINAGSTFIDNSFLYVNPVNCLIYSQTTKGFPIEVALKIPKHWQIAGVENNKNRFKRTNFDQLADTPFIASSDLLNESYWIGVNKFTIWFHRQKNIPWKRILNDFSKFSEKLITAFGELPSNRYEFIILSLPYPAYHGVEHLESTVITLGPSYDIFDNLYQELLGVSCHELYHVWNVKTIRPLDLLPYDFSQENYSQLGFIYEGITTYFGDLFLAKSNILSNAHYLKELCDQFQKHADNFGKRNISLADTSIDTWVDGYVPGVPDRKISIYTEGCLFAFWLDVTILKETKNSENLQSVMKSLYYSHGKKNKGYDLNDFCSTVKNIIGKDIKESIYKFIFNRIDFISELSSILDDLGLVIECNPGIPSERILGIKTLNSNGNQIISGIHPNGTAKINRLQLGDELIAINGIKIKGDLEKWLSYFENSEIELSIFRNGRLMSFPMLEISPYTYEKLTLISLPSPSEEQQSLFSSWIR